MLNRMPRWQHVVLMLLCAAGLVAAIANVAVADSWGTRGLHALLGLLIATALVRLFIAYRRRPAEEAEPVE
jgi:hypothetical protein